MSKLRNIFASNLKTTREKRGFTQEEIAEKLDISVRYVQRLEGKKPPNVKLDTIEKLAKVLKASPTDFLKS